MRVSCLHEATPQSAYPGEAMNIDLYSDRAKQAIQSAQSLALARRHQQLAPEP